MPRSSRSSQPTRRCSTAASANPGCRMERSLPRHHAPRICARLSGKRLSCPWRRSRHGRRAASLSTESKRCSGSVCSSGCSAVKASATIRWVVPGTRTLATHRASRHAGRSDRQDCESAVQGRSRGGYSCTTTQLSLYGWKPIWPSSASAVRQLRGLRDSG